MMLDRPAKRGERQRRYRKRQVAGVLVVSVVVTPEETAKLGRLHLLNERELENRRAIAEAMKGLLASVEA
jgi:hypothetical protein